MSVVTWTADVPRVLWRQEREKFLRAIEELPRHRVRRRAEMLILMDTGCRVGELAALRVCDYDRQRKSLMLINIKAAGHPVREVPLTYQSVRALNAWLRERPNMETDALFVSQEGKALSIRTIQDDYKIICQAAGITGQGIHTLRHTSATRLLDDHVLDVHQVSRRLGHRSISTTYRYYTHASVEAEADAVRKSKL